MKLRWLIYPALVLAGVGLAATFYRVDIWESALVHLLAGQGFTDIQVEVTDASFSASPLQIKHLSVEHPDFSIRTRQLSLHWVDHQLRLNAGAIHVAFKDNSTTSYPTLNSIGDALDALPNLPVGVVIGTDSATLCIPECTTTRFTLRLINDVLQTEFAVLGTRLELTLGQQLHFVARHDYLTLAGELQHWDQPSAELHLSGLVKALPELSPDDRVSIDIRSARFRALVNVDGQTPLIAKDLSGAINAKAILTLDAAVDLDDEDNHLSYAGVTQQQLSLERNELKVVLDDSATLTLTATDLTATADLAASSSCSTTLDLLNRTCELTFNALVAQSGDILANSSRAMVHYQHAENADRIVINGPWQVTTPGWPMLTGQTQITTDTVSADIEATNTYWGSLPVDTVSTRLTLDDLAAEFAVKTEAPLSTLTSLPFAADLENLDGELHLAINGAWDPDQGFSVLNTVTTIQNGTLTYDGYDLVSINTRISLEGYPVHKTASPANLIIELIDVGVPLRQVSGNVSGDIDLSSSTIQFGVTEFTGEVLGGFVSASDIRGRFQESLDASGTFTLSDLDLNQILAVERDDFLSEGRIGGSVPVQVKDGNLTISAGMLSAAAPGGYIRYTPDSSLTASLANNNQVAFVVDTLADFQYHGLDAEVSYTPEGDMIAVTTIQGSNPAIENGREIRLNLTLEENVGTLLRSLRISEVFTDRIEARTKKQ